MDENADAKEEELLADKETTGLHTLVLARSTERTIVLVSALRHYSAEDLGTVRYCRTWRKLEAALTGPDTPTTIQYRAVAKLPAEHPDYACNSPLCTTSIQNPTMISIVLGAPVQRSNIECPTRGDFQRC